MNSLPEELENIIMNYKYQNEHFDKIKSTLNQIKNISYCIEINESKRILDNKITRYVYENNNYSELWNNTSTIIQPYTNGIYFGMETERTIIISDSKLSVCIEEIEYHEMRILDIDDLDDDLDEMMDDFRDDFMMDFMMD